LFGTTWVSRYQKKHSPTHTYRGHQSSLVCFLHLLRSMAFSLFNLCAWVFNNLCPGFVWSTSWPGTLHFILYVQMKYIYVISISLSVTVLFKQACLVKYLKEYLNTQHFFSICPFSALTLLVGYRKSIQRIKNWVMRCWCGYLSGVKCKWFAYGPADVTATLLSLALLKSWTVLPFWYHRIQVVLEKRL